VGVLSNYDITYNTSTLTITPRSITVTANNQTKVYGENDPTLSYAVTSGSLVNGDSFIGTLSRTAGENVGSYPINQGTLTLSNNYTLSFVGATLTITQGEVIVTPTAQSKTYGETDPVFSFSTSPAVATTGSLGRMAGNNVGQFDYTLNTLSAGSNYTLRISSNTAKFSILPKVVTGSFTASNKVYDGNSNATVSGRTLNGVIAGDDVSLVGGIASFTDASVGNGKTVSLVGASLSGTASGNYSLTVVSTAQASISRRDVTITPNNASKTYGDGYIFPANAFSVTGLVNPNDINNVVLSSIGATSTATVGNYDIEIVNVNGNAISNYNINRNKGVLTVNRRNITVVGAETADKEYDGTTNAAITSATLSGTLSGDDVSLVVSASFVSKNANAAVAINPNFSLNGNARANYNLVQPSLTPRNIAKHSIVVRAIQDTKVYDGTIASLKTPEIIAGEIKNGDVADFAQQFSDPVIGFDKTITPFGNVLDGNNGNNYSYTFISLNNGRIITAIALPVTLINFTAKPTTDGKVALAWTTSTESANRGFRLERQIEGQSKWEKIGFVASKAPGGNSNRILNYAYTDMNPKLGAVMLYRLAQEDIDGKTTYSEIKAVKLDGRPVATISPNPSSGNLTIKRTADGRKMDVFVVDVAGRVIQQTLGVTESEFRLRIDFNGLYTIRMVYPETGEQSLQRIVIQK
jgi:hypothetical protein